MVRRTGWIGMGVVVFAAMNVARSESVDDVQKKLVEAHAKMKSYSCKMKTVQNMDMGGGNKMSSDYTGTVEWSRKGEKYLFRSEMKGNSVQNFGGQENKMEASATIICDGDMVYTLSTQMGQTMAMKQKPDGSMGGEPKKVFEDLLARNNVKVLADEKVDGESCFVLEATPKDPAEAATMSKTVMYFRKDVGINVKTVGFDKDGKEIFTNTSTDFKLNSEIDAARFVFKAPEGVQVMDMTNQ